MKTIQYLSPTSIATFYRNQEEFYVNYLSDNRPDRFPQTQPMSVGSSFDAYAKSFLHAGLFGPGKDPKFEFEAIFEAQVEPHNRDWARPAGKHCFDEYKKSGALSDLMLDLQGAVGEPRFEIEVRGIIQGEREGVTLKVDDMMLLGKPDCSFTHKRGARVILDWKVNGYCAQRRVYPMQGYLRLREFGKNKGSHRECIPMSHKGMQININTYLEACNQDWARQLAIYGWLCGEDVGSDFIVAVDQLACGPDDLMMSPNPIVRIAEHRLRVSADFQWKIFAQAQHIWSLAHSDHFFRDLSKQDSLARCQALDGMAAALRGDGNVNDDWFAKTTRI